MSAILIGAHLESLVGKTIFTITGRPNAVLRVDDDVVLVGTDRSPEGQKVAKGDIEAAYERLIRDGEIEINPGSVGYRSAFIGAVLSTLPGVEIETRPARIRLENPISTIILLGCVKEKGSTMAPAADLYISRLWRARRRYAEASGLPWFILSAKHGLLTPSQVIAPYDMALKDRNATERRAWGIEVVEKLEIQFGDLRGIVAEIHAGAPYRNAVRGPMEAMGATLVNPVTGLRDGGRGPLPQGELLSWYQTQEAQKPPSERQRAILRLTNSAERLPVSSWPGKLPGLELPGLYSWNVDVAGARHLSAGLDHEVSAGLVYAGQTGATKWPSGQRPRTTLKSRIGQSHIGGRIRGSTFRFTLAAALLKQLDLKPIAPKKLSPESDATHRMDQSSSFGRCFPIR